MPQANQYDINKCENVLKHTVEKTQVLNYWETAVAHGKSFRENDGMLAQNDDAKQIAVLVLQPKDVVKNEKRLIKAGSRNSIKAEVPTSDIRSVLPID